MRPLHTLALLLALPLAGCATLNESECRGGDWYTIGVRDGANGRADERLLEHAKACAEYGVQPDRERWLEGRDAGLERYCTARNGLSIGEVGGPYNGVCFASAEDEFLRGYNLGRELNRVKGDLDAVENEIRILDGRLRQKELSEEERRRIEYRLRDYEYRRGYLRRDYDELEWRARSQRW
jgi:hypothetical protein